MFRRGTSYGPPLAAGVLEDDGADRRSVEAWGTSRDVVCRVRGRMEQRHAAVSAQPVGAVARLAVLLIESLAGRHRWGTAAAADTRYGIGYAIASEILGPTGGEFAGEIVETGSEVTGFSTGTRVFGITAGEAQAEYIKIVIIIVLARPIRSPIAPKTSPPVAQPMMKMLVTYPPHKLMEGSPAGTPSKSRIEVGRANVNSC